MHPLLTRNRFGLYLLAWIPLTGILVYALAAGGRLGWFESTVLAIPLCLLYAFIGLSTWYSVKSTPLAPTELPKIAITHLLGAALLSLVWVQIGRFFAYLLSSLPRFEGLSCRFAQQLPNVFTVGLSLYFLSVAFHYVLLSAEAAREAERRVLQSNILAREAELKALKAQVNPHFLFNSLNSISALTSIDPAKAREMCILLADFLRMTLGLGERSSIPLSDELALLERFLAIEKVRFGARLRMEEEIEEECKTMLVPALLLQPLVENAVAHGIANLPEGGCIRLSVRCQDETLNIAIENSYDPESTSSRRNGMGIQNVRRRLEARYGSSANIRVSTEAERFRVDLTLPAQTRENES
jgi:two-component system sensor histidine kinase AlgZ